MASLFLQILNNSIAAGWVVLAVVLVRLLLKKAPKAVCVALWGLVALRLLLPFSIESPLSLVPNMTPIADETTATTALSGTETTAVSTLSSTSPITAAKPTTVPTTKKTTVQADTLQTDATKTNAVAAQVETDTTTVPPKTETHTLSWSMIAAIVWCVGIAAMLLYAAVSMWRVRRCVRASVRLHDRVYICDEIDTPFILGVIRPRVVLPSTLTEEERDMILAHEYAHLRRGDHIIKPFGFLLLTVYWFNPLVWLAYLLMCKDIELACDERVLKTLDDEKKKTYLETLLLYCSRPDKATVCPLAFGETGVKERIFSALSYKKPTLWILLISVLAAVAIAVCFLTVRPSKSSPDEPSRKPTQTTQKATTSIPLTFSLPKEGVTLKMTYTHWYADGENDGGEVVFQIDPTNRLLFVDSSYEDESGKQVEWMAVDGTNWYSYSVVGGEVQAASTAAEDMIPLIWQSIESGTLEPDLLLSAEENDLIAAIQNFYIDTNKLESNVAAFMAKAANVQWLEENLGYTEKIDGDVKTQSFAVSGYQAVQLLKEMVGDALKQEMFFDSLLVGSKAEQEAMMWTLSVETRSDEFVRAILSYNDAEGNRDEFVLELVEIGKPAIDLSDLKTLIEEENGGRVTCIKCNLEPAALKGYCQTCYYDSVCLICGRDKNVTSEGYCTDCFVPCAICRSRHGEYEHEDELLCYTCYYARFCLNDDGNPVYQKGYCESCYEPCSLCFEQAEYEVDGVWYCYICYYLQYCYNDDGNPVYQNGYCEDCYVPCDHCGIEQADYEVDGKSYCFTCYYTHYNDLSVYDMIDQEIGGTEQ